MRDVMVRHGEMVSDVVSIGDDGRYFAGTWLPETKRMIGCECGAMRKSREETEAALLARGYQPAPLAMDPARWRFNATPTNA